MSIKDIYNVIQQFAQAAHFMSEVGFAGIELHGARKYIKRSVGRGLSRIEVNLLYL